MYINKIGISFYPKNQSYGLFDDENNLIFEGTLSDCYAFIRLKEINITINDGTEFDYI